MAPAGAASLRDVAPVAGAPALPEGYATASEQIARRQAALALHPDRGGAHEDFVKLQRAKEALGL